jgi:hypothetical protein
VQTFFADDVHRNPQPPRGRIEMLPPRTAAAPLGTRLLKRKSSP